MNPKRNVAVIILYNSQKKILLQHRANDAKRNPGYWAFFGGGLEPGESPEAAVKRETGEELNYQLQNPKLITVKEARDPDLQGTMYVYIENTTLDKHFN